jgi:HEAT repeat protein
MAMHDADAAARSWALGALGKYRDPSLLPLLLNALKDDSWIVRNGAAAGIGELGDASAVEPLRSELREIRLRPRDWYLCRTAIKRALRKLLDST